MRTLMLKRGYNMLVLIIIVLLLFFLYPFLKISSECSREEERLDYEKFKKSLD